MTPQQTAQELAGLRLQVKALQEALGAFIDWTAQSANSPIRRDEASTLLNILHGHEPGPRKGKHDGSR
jgi:hypothetical protein